MKENLDGLVLGVFNFNINLNPGPKEGADNAPLPKCCVGGGFWVFSAPYCSLQHSCSATAF